MNLPHPRDGANPSPYETDDAVWMSLLRDAADAYVQTRIPARREMFVEGADLALLAAILERPEVPEQGSRS